MIFENNDRIVFAGDSITDMESAYPIGEGLFDNVGKSYVRVIENLLSSVYPKTYVRVTNSAVGGETSRDMLNRWKECVLDLNPDWVSICIGINDVWRQFDTPAMPDKAVSPEEYRENLKKALDSLKGKVKGVFLVTPYYMEPNKEDFMAKRMDEYADICRGLAEEYKDLPCTLVDFQKLYDRYLTIRHSSYIAWDRVHPNQIGATLMAREFLSHCDFDFNHKEY